MPFLISEPASLMMAPETEVLPEPVTVRTLPARLREVPAVSASEPRSDWMVEAAAKVTAPPKVFAPLRLRREPLLAEPDPAIDSDSETTVMLPWSSSEPPALTTVPARAVPSALA